MPGPAGRRVFAIGVVIQLATWAVMIPGCSGGGGSGSAPGAGVNAGLEQFVGEGARAADAESAAAPSRDDIRRWLEDDAAILPSLAGGRTPESPVIAGRSPASANPTPTIEITPDDKPEAESRSLRKESKPVAVATPEETPRARRDRLVAELSDALRAAVRTSPAPLREYSALAALELLSPGIAPDPLTVPALTPREIELLGSWRDLFRSVNDSLAGSTDDAGALADAVEGLARSMSQWKTLGVAHAALCSRVDGFGQFVPLPGSAMLAGRRNAAILYVEAENFTHRGVADETGEPGYAVELTQELSLYHDADGLLAWRMPAQEIRDVSKRRRRDFFIVQRVDLPETLTVGAYRLKVTLRDKVSGAIAEEILPIQIVADPALVRAR